MAAVLKMILLGVVQGATEFLPVSSSGHLTIVQEFVGIKENRILLDVFLHVGTLIAILAVFRKDIAALFSSKMKWIPYLVVATLPAAAVGLTLHSPIKRLFESVTAVGGLLIGNSVILAVGSIAGRRKQTSSDVRLKGALAVGLAQSVAILPGISRSGTTISSGLLMGWERTLAVRFSFLLAIPAIVGGTAFEVMKSRSELASGGVFGMGLFGMVVSAAVGYAALRILLGAVQKGKLWVFSGYCFVVGAALIVYGLVS